LLTIVADGEEHTIGEIIDGLAAHFHVTDDDRRDMLPSGKESRFDNRARWAGFHLRKAGILESTGWGRLRITRRGLDVLHQRPVAIDIKFLLQFPEFREFRSSSQRENAPPPGGGEEQETPQEALESTYQRLRDTLAQDLLERVRAAPPRFFEKLVLDLLVAMGYGGSRKDAGQAVGQSGDGGIDGIIKEDKLGLDVVYVQAKRWEGTVGRPTVQAFAGSLEGQRARKGVLITTSQFSPEAREYVGKIEKKIVLIPGEELARLMIDHGIGVTELASYTVKKIDLDYFGEEG
jgi:restriction system protein